ncbi:MAG: primosomal protein N' [Firmicutes bacterium]|nr:primosomal protein N' [Bacillota bacterium]
MIYKVIVDISNSEVDKVFFYHSDFPLELGMRVKVPFGHREIEGFVVGTAESSPRETKAVIKALDPYPVVLPEMVWLLEPLSKKKLRYIDCLRLFIPSKLRGGKVKALERNYIDLCENFNTETASSVLRRNSFSQFALIERLSEGGMFEADILKEFSLSTVNSLIEKGIVVKRKEELERVPIAMPAQEKYVVLTAEQREAIEKICGGSDKKYLIHGVTGSGKTEVYLNIIERVLEQGKTAIMLVPEISLTPQMLGVFRARFGENVSLIHSKLSDGERYDEWRRLRLGKAKVALGARSAIFAPLQNVGAIIIDEEHDGSYVSETNPRYFTQEIAELRAEYNNAKLILGSATPSMESYLKAENKEYKLITLLNRVNQREMPLIDIVDMKKEIRNGNVSAFSGELLEAIEQTINSGEQAIIFLNRRGYASFIRCRSCGYVAKCADCDVSLTYHKEDETLKCHYCKNQYHAISQCPICGFKGLKEGRTGTQKIAEELQIIFPNARIARMDLDTTSGKDSYSKILSGFAEHNTDILVGTQMIAKGHDFPLVTLVGILDADQSLYFSDYRSLERTFQLITQVAGRAGRERKAGKVVLQTYSPNHFVFRFALKYDYKGFYSKEINNREVAKFPPFTKIIRILMLAKEEQNAMNASREIYTKQKKLIEESAGDIIRIQIMRAPIKRIENNFRFQILIWAKADANDEVIDKIYQNASTEIKNVAVFIEINPQQLF